MRNLFTALLFALIAFLGGSASASVRDNFFGDNFSLHERQEIETYLEKSHQAIDAITNFKAALDYSEIQKGDCGSVADIEGKAKQGDAFNQWILSDLFNRGLCLKINPEEARKWVERATGQGFSRAYFDRAIFYFQGVGGPKDEKAAYEWFKKAAIEANEDRAFGMLALMDLGGEGTTANFIDGIKWSRAGAEKGDSLSQALLANILSTKEYADPIESYKWALIAVQSDNQVATKISKEVINTWDKINLPNEIIVKAQTLAKNWKPVSAKINFDSKPLPELPDDYSDKLSSEEALEALQKFNLGKDRFFFMQAIKENNLGVFKLFVKAGASVETTRPDDNATPLFRAASFGSEKIVDYLLENKANINVKVNKDGDTPILTAISDGHISIAKKLLNAGADVSHRGIIFNAVETNDPKFIDDLYRAGAKQIDNDYVGTPLSHAVSAAKDDRLTEKYCFEKSVEFLLLKGADPNKIDNRLDIGQSILMDAVGSRNPEACVSLLLKHKANAKYKNNDGQSVLYYALLSGNPKVVEMLLDAGADANEVYRFPQEHIAVIIESDTSRDVLMKGGTPLMLAISEDHVSAAKILLENGANPLIRTDNGLTAELIAKTHGNKLVLDLIEKYKGEHPLKSFWAKLHGNSKKDNP